MPAHPITPAFVAGELTQQLAGRVDLQKYGVAGECLRNFLVLPHGGITKRAGTFYIRNSKHQDGVIRLEKFEFSIEQAYLLEFGEGFIRVHTRGALVAEVVTPYSAADVESLDVKQSADVMWIYHRDHAPRELIRTGADEFTIRLERIRVPPTDEPDVFPDTALSLSATSGVGVIATLGASYFLDGDVGREITTLSGRGAITAITSGTVAVVTVADEFESTFFAAGDWSLNGSPNHYHLEVSAAGFDVGTEDIKIVPPRVALVACHDGDDNPKTCFRAEDVGKYIWAGDGVMKIIEVLTGASVMAQAVEQMTLPNSLRIFPQEWTLEASQWSDDLGWPGVLTLHDQRKVVAGSWEHPEKVWGSVVGDYPNYYAGSLDDEGFEYVLAQHGVNMIRGLVSGDSLAVLTIAGEHVLSGSNSGPITPTDIDVSGSTDEGKDDNIPALKHGPAVIFVQRGRQRLMELAYNWENDRHISNDLSRLAEHLTRAGITSIAIQRRPEPIVFATNADGQLLSLTYTRLEGVVAWAHHETVGFVEAVQVIPNNCGTGEEVWIAVRRTAQSGEWFLTDWFLTDWFLADWFLNADEVEYRALEVFDGRTFLDSSLAYAGPEAATFTGMGHLNGQTIAAVVDGEDVYEVEVSGGQFTLPDGVTATTLVAGHPYTATLKTMRPVLATQAGSAQGARQKWAKAIVRVYCTEGELTINTVGELGTVTDQNEPLSYPEDWDTDDPYTGDLEEKADVGTWTRTGQLVIQHADPKPCTILAIMGSVELENQ